MTIVEFEQINQAQQLDLILANGHAISERRELGLLYVRYHIFDFCVELYYRRNVLSSLNIPSFTSKCVEAA